MVVILYTGPMYAGKTNKLIEIYRTDPKNTYCFKFFGDTRYHCEDIVSHDQLHIPAVKVKNLNDIQDIKYP